MRFQMSLFPRESRPYGVYPLVHVLKRSFQSVLSEYGQACAEELVTHIVDAARSWAHGRLRDDNAVFIIGRDV